MVQREWTPEDYITILRRRWPQIVILGILGALLGYGVSRLLPNRYTSQSLVVIDQPTVPIEFVKPVVTSGVTERLSSMQQQLLSQARLELLVHQLNLFPDESNRVPVDALARRLRTAITVMRIREGSEEEGFRVPGFHVSVTLDQARAAQAVCSAVTSMFMEENRRRREQNSEKTTQFLSQQIVEAKQKLDEQDAKLAAFKSRYVGFLPEDVQTNLSLLAGLNSEFDATTQALARAQQDKSMAESMLTQQIAAWRASQTGHNPDTYEEQLAAFQTQLSALQARYTENHPDVIKAKIEIEALKKKIAESEEQNKVRTPGQPESREPSQFKPMRAQIRAYDQTIVEKTAQQQRIQAQIKHYQERVQSSPVIEQQYKELTRDYQTALEGYNDLSKKRTQSTMAADLERNQEAEQFRLLEAANLPAAPSFPNRLLFALGGLGGGLALAIGLAFVLAMRDTSLRTEKDVELVLQLPVLAQVPPMHALKPVRPVRQLPISIGKA